MKQRIVNVLLILVSICILVSCEQGGKHETEDMSISAVREETKKISNADDKDISYTEDEIQKKEEITILEDGTDDRDSIEYELNVSDEDVKSALSEWDPKGSNDFYLMPDSSTRSLTAEELTGLNETELRLVRNEIAARHGWDFSDPVLKSYFITQKWYEPEEGKNEQVRYEAKEAANMQMIIDLENSGNKQKTTDFHIKEQLVELECGKNYELSFDDMKITLGQAEEDPMMLTINGKATRYSYNNEKSKILLYNRKDESYLIISGMYGENDYDLSDIYLLNRNGIHYIQYIDGYIVCYTKNAFCCKFTGEGLDPFYDECVDTYRGYEWHFLYEGLECLSMGSAVIESSTYKITKELPCYVKKDDNISEIVVTPGEMVSMVSRDERFNNVYWIGFMRGEGMVYLPVFVKSGVFERCEDGMAPYEHFKIP